MINFNKPPKDNRDYLVRTLVLLLSCPRPEEATEEIQYLASEAERMLGLIDVSEHDDIRSQVAEEMKKLNFNKNPNIYKYLFGETYTTIQ